MSAFLPDTLVSALPRVGEALTKKLKYLGIETVRDLIFYFPFRYDDFRTVVKIGKVKESVVGTMHGRIELIANRRSPRKRTMLTEAVVADDTGRARIIWFNQPFLTKILHVGDTVSLAGTITTDLYGPQMVSPVYEKIAALGRVGGEDANTTHTGRLVPVYSLTAGVTAKNIRTLLRTAMGAVPGIHDAVPAAIRRNRHLVPLATALAAVHFPEDEHELAAARHRLKFDEFFLQQLAVQRERLALLQARAPIVPFNEKAMRQAVVALPFTLTRDQKVTLWQVIRDMQSPHPMNRLVQGDVGSGKTVVAALAAYHAALAGFQSVFMAPTEILAIQHFETIAKILAPYNITVALVTSGAVKIAAAHGGAMMDGGSGIKGSTKDSVAGAAKGLRRTNILKEVAKGEVQIIIGTHALLQDEVIFADVALVVVDEQHRFGVRQRKALKDKTPEVEPHFLSMSATPIPRSLALTLYGDLSISQIRQMPRGRRLVITKIVQQENQEKAYEFIRGQLRAGRQAFVVCPLIDESDKLDVASAAAEVERLQREVFSNFHVGLLHGKMKAKEKEEIMRAFVDQEIHVLVSTSVIEVGVDVPNATVMLIEGGERFGLAQLHQFRGRVGRGEHQAYCFVFADANVQTNVNYVNTARQRLEIFSSTNDGFILAERDLALRGPGELYGVEQSGFSGFKIARLSDIHVIEEARDAAKALLQEDLELKKHPELRVALAAWLHSVHLE